MESAYAHSFDQQGRLYWAPALANGAATITLLGLAGGTQDPDFALSGLAPSIALFAFGLGSGLLAILWARDWAVGLAELAANLQDRRLLVAELQRLEGISPPPMDIETATLYFGSLAKAIEAIRKGWASKFQAAAVSMQGNRDQIAKIDLRNAELGPIVQGRASRAVFFSKISIAFCAVAFAWTLVGHEAGIFQLASS